MAKAYERIADELRDEIRTGRLAAGERLPSEEALRDRFGKSNPTIRQALALLVSEGLIEKQHGRGTFVRRPRTRVVRTNTRHQWEKDRAREAEDSRSKTGSTEHDTGLDVSELVFTATYRETGASGDIAEVLDVPEGTAVLERTYATRYAAERHPFNVSRSYIPKALIEDEPALLDETKEPWPGGTYNQFLTVGIEIDRVEEQVTARPPSADELEELGLPQGTAVMQLRKALIDVEDRTVEVAYVTLPGDRTELQFTTPLERW